MMYIASEYLDQIKSLVRFGQPTINMPDPDSVSEADKAVRRIPNVTISFPLDLDVTVEEVDADDTKIIDTRTLATLLHLSKVVK